MEIVDDERTELPGVRGPHRCLSTSLAMQKAGGKLIVELDDEGKTYKAVGENSSDFSYVLGGLVRDYLPPFADKWTDIPKENVAEIYPRMREWFQFKDTAHARLSVKRDAQARFRDWKNELHTEFQKAGGMKDLAATKAAVPKKLEGKDDVWQKCCDRFSSPAFQEMRKRNSQNRSKKKSVSRQGSKTYAAYRHQNRNKETGKLMSIVDNFREHHTIGGKFVDEPSRLRYEQMVRERDSATQAASSQGGSVDHDAIERQAVESVMRSGRGYRGAVGPVLGKLSGLAVDLSEASSAAAVSTSRPPVQDTTQREEQTQTAQFMSSLSAVVQWVVDQQTGKSTTPTPPPMPVPPPHLIPPTQPPAPPEHQDDDDDQDDDGLD